MNHWTISSKTALIAALLAAVLLSAFMFGWSWASAGISSQQLGSELQAQWSMAHAAWLTLAAGLFSLLLSIAGLIYVALTFRKTAETLELARDTSRTELRAYVSVQANWISSFDESSYCWTKIEAKNTGSTPALRLRNVTFIMALPLEVIDSAAIESIPPTSKIGVPVSSQGSITINYTRDAKFSLEELQGIRDGSRKICVFVTVWYDDVFGTEHMTQAAFWASASDDHLEKLTSNYLDKDLEVTFTHIDRFHQVT